MELTDTWRDDEYVSVASAAKILGVHPDTVRRYEAQGLIAATRTPTNHRRFRVGDVRALRNAASAA